MQSFVRRLSGVAMAGLVVLALVQPVQAQFGPGGNNPPPGGNPLFQMNPNLNPGMGASPLSMPLPGTPIGRPVIGGNPYLASASLTSVSTPSIAGTSFDTPSTQYSPYYNPYLSNYDPFGGYFRGIGDLTIAYGKYQIDYQRARLLNQEVERSIMDSRRRFWEEMRLERAMQPTADDLINQNRERELARARKQPQDTDITSGKSLNILLAHAKASHARNQFGPPISIEADVLKRVNVTSGNGNIGLIRNGGKLQWPAVMRGDPYEKATQSLEFAIDDAINRARINGRVDANIVKDMEKDLQTLHAALDQNIGKMLLSEHTAANRYLNMVEDAITALKDPQVANYFNKKYEAQGRTVRDLVDYMAREGLSFAASAPGDEGGYRALQTYLSAYDDVLTQYASR